MAMSDAILGKLLNIPEYNALYDLRDMHIDASKDDDQPTAALANLLIWPTPEEINPWLNADGTIDLEHLT